MLPFHLRFYSKYKEEADIFRDYGRIYQTNPKAAVLTELYEYLSEHYEGKKVTHPFCLEFDSITINVSPGHIQLSSNHTGALLYSVPYSYPINYDRLVKGFDFHLIKKG